MNSDPHLEEILKLKERVSHLEKQFAAQERDDRRQLRRLWMQLNEQQHQITPTQPPRDEPIPLLTSETFWSLWRSDLLIALFLFRMSFSGFSLAGMHIIDECQRSDVLRHKWCLSGKVIKGGLGKALSQVPGGLGVYIHKWCFYFVIPALSGTYMAYVGTLCLQNWATAVSNTIQKK